jgi:hypothetical protein
MQHVLTEFALIYAFGLAWLLVFGSALLFRREAVMPGGCAVLVLFAFVLGFATWLLTYLLPFS